jgi:MFS family permease
LWVVIAALGSATVVSFAILAEYFPKELTGRANAALNVFHMGGAFALQCLMGFVIQAWAKHEGHYPEIAYQAAFAINVLLQVAALLWFSLPRLQQLASAINRQPIGEARRWPMRPRSRTWRVQTGHPQRPFMRCITCGSITALGDQMPIIARPAI